jgi:PAS domain S-box-containing protein
MKADERSPDAERYRILFERSHVGIAFVAVDGPILAVNPAACRLWGRSEAELLGLPATELIHPEDQEPWLANLRRLARRELDVLRTERRFQRPDGTTVWADSTTQAMRGADGKVVYWQSVLVDITDRKRAEEDQARLAAIVQSSNEAIIGSTLDGVITSWNPGAERLYGYTANEVIGERGDFLLPPDKHAEAGLFGARIAAGERVQEYLTTRLRKDGRRVRVAVSASPIFDRTGATVGVASVTRDLTEQERAEARFHGLLEAAPVAIIAADVDWRVVLANAHADRLFGYPIGGLIGESIRKLVPTYTAAVDAGERPRLSERMAPGESLTVELSARRRNGEEFSAEISLTTLQTDDTWLAVAGVRDASERQLAAIVQSSQDAIFAVNLDGRITSWNSGAEQTYGYTHSEMVGRMMFKLVPADKADELESILAVVARGERVEQLETQRVRKDGTVIDVSLSVAPIRDAAGTITGASAVARDVTTTKRALEDLLASEARKTAILDSALDCIVSIDHAGRVVEFNPAAERVFGYARADVLGREMAELIIPPGLRDEHRAGLRRFLSTGEGRILGQRLELDAMRADGSVFPAELAVTKVEVEGPPLFTGYLRDVTERNRIRADLVSSQAQLQAILDNSPAVIWLTDVDGRYQLVNRQFERIHGIERASVLGRTAADLWPEDEAHSRRQVELEVIETGEPQHSEEVHEGPDGERTYVSVVFPLFDAGGTLYATAGLWTDITERKAAEAERQALQERIRQSDRLESLGQLAGGVAHDFNNLLNAILAYANFIVEGAVDAPSVRSDAEEITVAAQHAVRLTRQLLLFARRAPAEPEILDLNEVLADTGNLLSRTIGEHIDLVVRGGANLPTIRADRGQVEQVVMNLAVNARDAMREGGALTIETRHTELGEDYVRTHPGIEPGHYVELAVSDTGIGMSPEVVARIFEPFYTTKPRGEGTGLGLATVYGVLADSGGGLSVYSEEGVGTTFRAYFPVADAAVTTPRPTASALVSAIASGTFLVVEDEPSVMKVTSRILRERGYTVLEATNGEEALTIIADHELQLVLTDSVMPKMSGRELALRVEELRPGLPVLFMSGYSEGVLGPGRAAGESLPLLQKPFTAHDLLERVQTLIARGLT